MPSGVASEHVGYADALGPGQIGGPPSRGGTNIEPCSGPALVRLLIRILCSSLTRDVSFLSLSSPLHYDSVLPP